MRADSSLKSSYINSHVLETCRRKRQRDKEKAMGKSLCCDKAGIKKGPWTPEEDIILVSYIQKNGPGNWRSVPTNTGLMRCSKSCRLRWTNYLRPGIKRGNFTQHEEGLIIHLQSMLGNKWAAIASYLPQRTDNDIKNYWNTHLKKKINKYQPAINSFSASSDPSSICNELVSRFYSADNTNLHSTLPIPNQISSTTYASSTENISRLLEGWTRSSQKVGSTPDVKNDQEGYNSTSNGELKSLLPLEDPSNIAWEDSSSEATFYGVQSIPIRCDGNQRSDQTQNLPLIVLDNWLLDDEVVGQVDLSCPDGIY